jgi:hypothetical protein
VVTDLRTGLVWEQSEYNESVSWVDAHYRCNTLTFGGYSDWRLPSRIELESIVDYGRFSPSINPLFSVVGDQYYQGDWYWCGSPLARVPDHAFFVDFYRGGTGSGPKDMYLYVKCVRGETLASSSIVDNMNWTLTDVTTGLTWQKEEGAATNWEGALSYCETLELAEHTDWRLPNIRELQSIVDESVYWPALDPLFYSNSHRLYSSTTMVSQPDRAFHLNLSHDGQSSGWSKNEWPAFVRCVRGGP